MLRTYHHHVPSLLMTHEDMMWVYWYVHKAIQSSDRELKNPKGKADYLRSEKLCALAFARYFGLMKPWRKYHGKISLWPPWVDFRVAGHQLRIIGVPGREKRNFGANLVGKVWEKDFERGHSGYVLACWYPPYVDLVGWLPRDELRTYKVNYWYQLEESVVRPVNTLSGLRPTM